MAPRRPPPAPALPPTARPLLVTEDPALLDDLLRLAAAAGVDPEVAALPAAARGRWAAAPLVLLDSHAAAALGHAGLPRPRRLVLVAVAPAPSAVWERAVEVGAQHVAVLPEAEEWLLDELVHADASGGVPGRVIGVLGGRGGSGASALSVALALSAVSSGHRCVLVDVDPLGGGGELLLATTGTGGTTWSDLEGARGRLSPRALAAALPEVAGVSVLTSVLISGVAEAPETVVAGPPVDAVLAVLDGARLAAGVTVADLPRTPGDTLAAALSRVDHLLLVVPAELRAVVAAARLAAFAAGHCGDLRVVVRGPSPAGLSARDVERVLGLPVAGVLRDDPLLAAALERGDRPSLQPRRPLGRLCSALLADLAPPPARTAPRRRRDRRTA